MFRFGLEKNSHVWFSVATKPVSLVKVVCDPPLNPSLHPSWLLL